MSGLAPEVAVRGFGRPGVTDVPLTSSRAPQMPDSNEPPQTLIDIGERHTVVVARRGTATDVRLELPIGARRTAEQLFRHDPPRPIELEAAIDAVEDQVMRVAGLLPPASALRMTGSAAGEIRGALLADERVNPVVALAEVEQLFQRLASASLGNPAARQGLPTGNGFVATALILREFMHHLGFASVELQPDAM